MAEEASTDSFSTADHNTASSVTPTTESKHNDLHDGVGNDGEDSKPNDKKHARFHVENLDQKDSHELNVCDTIGYATHEAVPLTVFYRNESSIGPVAKQRPTLRDLHKGYDEIDDQEPDDDVVIESSPELDIKITNPAPSTKLKFGWVQGVLVPCLLNIWGVILYLRLPWLTGQAGIGLITVIILMAAVVTTITTLSMSAICTNGEIKGGGAYYLISRSLGPEFGGSIGIIFSLANAVGVALYVVGFGETIQKLMAEHNASMIDEVNDVRIIGLIVVVLLLLLTLVGLEWVVRTQMFLLGILLISMLNCFFGTIWGPLDSGKNTIAQKGFTGLTSSTFSANFGPEYRKANFFELFSIFFPAATGILAGANISGDLRDPQVAVPKGTLWAILISSLVYIFLAWMIGASITKDAIGVVSTTVVENATNAIFTGTSVPATNPTSVTMMTMSYNLSKAGNNATMSCAVMECKYGLLNDYQVLQKISLFGPVVLAGIFAATLSSALASLVGSPKTFQAVCRDKIFARLEYFGKGSGANDEPRRAYLLTFVISSGFIAIGQLNIIAPIISNFFLMSYALINYSVFASSLGRSPGWRPSFKYYNMWLSLVGFLVCIAIMFLVNWWAALITIFLVMSLYKYVDYKKPQINWGSSGQAHTYIKALRLAHTLNRIDPHVKNFRPQCLVLTGAPHTRPDLAYIVSHITKQVGLMMCGHVIVSKDKIEPMQVTLHERWLRQNNIKAFYSAVTAGDLRSGVNAMLQCGGLGKLRPNILFLGFKDNWQEESNEKVEEYVNIVHDAFDYHYGVAILRLPKGEHFEDGGSESDESICSDDGDELPGSQPSPFDGEVYDEDLNNSDSHASAASTPKKKEKRTKSKSISPIKKKRGVLLHNVELRSTLREKQKGVIDVWWLFDDGGLTILLPYLLRRSKHWSGCSLRVFSPKADRRQLKSNQVRMASLLKKFRIDFSEVVEVDGLNRHPQQKSIDAFLRLRSDRHVQENETPVDDDESKLTDAATELLDRKTLREIRLGELLREHSSASKLIVLTIPIPRKTDITPLHYMGWLEVLSGQLPPILLVRGNQTSVLTFYS